MAKDPTVSPSTIREPHVEWPSLKKPVRTTRTMRLQGERISVRCVILVNGSFYIADEDVHTPSGKRLARRGDYLWRNLELTTRRGFDSAVPEDQCFARFTSIWDLWRGARRIPVEYEMVRIPRALRQERAIRHLMRVTWTLHKAAPEAVARYVASATWVAGELMPTRNRKTREAGRRVYRAASVTDSRGRKNTGRLAPLHWSAMMQLEGRELDMRGINLRMNKRALVVAHYLEQIMRSEAELDDVVLDLLAADPGLPYHEARARNERNAERLERYAQELRRRPARPSQRAWVRAADDFEYAARCMRIPGLGDWRKPLQRVHNSRVLILGPYRRMEEVLFTVARLHAARDPSLVTRDQLQALEQEMYAIYPQLNQNLEEGFHTKPVSKCLPVVERILEILHRAGYDTTINYDLLTAVYELLKLAVAPF